MSLFGSLFRSAEKTAVKDVKAIEPANFVAPRAPTAPKQVVPTTRALGEPVEVPLKKPATGEIKPAQVVPKSGAGVGTTLGVVGAGAFLLPSFLGGGGGGAGGSGILGGLLGTAGSLGSTAIAASAATDLGGQAIGAASSAINTVLNDPLKLGIVAAIIVGALVLGRK